MNVTPRTRPHNVVDYSTLKPSDCFLWQGGIMVKGDKDQGAINLNTGQSVFNMCGDLVVPVDATVNWKYRKVTPKKKK